MAPFSSLFEITARLRLSPSIVPRLELNQLNHCFTYFISLLSELQVAFFSWLKPSSLPCCRHCLFSSVFRLRDKMKAVVISSGDLEGDENGQKD